MEIISEELKKRDLFIPKEYDFIIKRVIHTTADFDFSSNMVFSEDAVQSALDALEKGVTIVTDTNMTLTGINKTGLSRTHSDAVCYMADEDVAAEAKRLEITRAVVSVRKAVTHNPGCIYGVGNAPTALFELIDQMEAGFRPVLIIAVPVGFVNVTEAKDEVINACKKHKIPYIASLGNKGGSTVLAAIINALIYKKINRNL